MNNTENPQGNVVPKKKGGCLKIGLIIAAAFFIIGVIISIFSKGGKDTDPTNKGNVENKENAGNKGNAAKKDSLLVLGQEKLKSLSKKEDEFNKTNFYHDKTTPNSNYVNTIYPYIGEAESESEVTKGVKQYWLRMVFTYSGDNWIFAKKIMLNIDGKVDEFSPEFKRDNSGGSVWESVDMEVNDSYLTTLEAIANSKSTKIRFSGKYTNDRTISQKEKDRIKNVVSTYKLLKGIE